MSNIKKFDQLVWIKNKLSIGSEYLQTPRVSIDMSGKTDAIAIPNGNIIERPLTGSSSEHGYFRYNKNLNKFEGFQNLSWQQFITNIDLNVSPDMSLQFASGSTQTGTTDLYYNYNNKNLNLGDILSTSGLYSMSLGSEITSKADYTYSFGKKLQSESEYVFIGGYGSFIDNKSENSFCYQKSPSFSYGIFNSKYSIISGGETNIIKYSKNSTITGGYYNTITGSSSSENSDYSIISGGLFNHIIGDSTESSTACFIGGGSGNTINHGVNSGIIAGVKNKINVGNKGEGYGIIAGGKDNTIDSIYSSIISGDGNNVKHTSKRSNIINSRYSTIGFDTGTSKSQNMIINSSFSDIGSFEFSTIIGCNNLSAIRDNLVHVPDLYINKLTGTYANLLIGSDGIVISGATGTTIEYINDLFDVTSISPNNGDILTFDSGTSQWVTTGLSSYIEGTIINNQIAFGDSSNNITSSSELTWDDTYLQVSGTSSESVVISSTGSYHIGSPSTNGSWRLRINSDGNFVIEKRVSGLWQVGQTISV